MTVYLIKVSSGFLYPLWRQEFYFPPDFTHGAWSIERSTRCHGDRRRRSPRAHTLATHHCSPRGPLPSPPLISFLPRLLAGKSPPDCCPHAHPAGSDARPRTQTPHSPWRLAMQVRGRGRGRGRRGASLRRPAVGGQAARNRGPCGDRVEAADQRERERERAALAARWRRRPAPRHSAGPTPRMTTS